MATSNLTIDKDKLNLFNELFDCDHKNNLALVTELYYHVKYKEHIFDNVESFEYLEKAYKDDCEIVMMIFACQFREYTDNESTYHLNKCIDTLIVYKVLKMI